MSLHFHKLLIKDVRRETPDCISVAFEIPDDLKDVFVFRAGQNITIRHHISNKELRRSYSICTGVHENELRVAIKQT
ncbi:MAG: phenylacetic acid degradation protein, partial [Chitinophagaceae bacterium]